MLEMSEKVQPTLHFSSWVMLETHILPFFLGLYSPAQAPSVAACFTASVMSFQGHWYSNLTFPLLKGPFRPAPTPDFSKIILYPINHLPLASPSLPSPHDLRVSGGI